jgi:hypothetical protein
VNSRPIGDSNSDGLFLVLWSREIGSSSCHGGRLDVLEGHVPRAVAALPHTGRLADFGLTARWFWIEGEQQ